MFEGRARQTARETKRGRKRPAKSETAADGEREGVGGPRDVDGDGEQTSSSGQPLRARLGAIAAGIDRYRGRQVCEDSGPVCAGFGVEAADGISAGASAGTLERVGAESFGPPVQGGVRRGPLAEEGTDDLPQALVSLRVACHRILDDGRCIALVGQDVGGEHAPAPSTTGAAGDGDLGLDHDEDELAVGVPLKEDQKARDAALAELEERRGAALCTALLIENRRCPPSSENLFAAEPRRRGTTVRR